MQSKDKDNDDYELLFKIVLVGDAGVGKTYLLNRYVKGETPKNDAPTIGVEFATKTVKLKETGHKIKTQIWDTAGQERYRSITSAHYRRAVGALLVYDITKEKSFQSLQKWLQDLKYQAEQDIVIMLVGNKLDLVEADESARKVTLEEAQEFANENNIQFQEASAKTNIKVTDVFEDLLQQICKVRQKSEKSNNQRLLKPDSTSKPKEDENCQC